MKLDDLAVFMDVFRRGSFAEAARLRDVVPSSVSRTIAALEEKLGVRLFQRSTRTLVPTEEGTALFAALRTRLPDLQDSLSSIKPDGEPSGTLVISASTSFGHEVIVPLLGRFTDAHPEISFDLRLSDIQSDIIAEGIDIAFRHGALADSALISRRFRCVRYFLVASRTYLEKHGVPRAPDDLMAHRLGTFAFPDYRSHWTFASETENRRDLDIAPMLISTTALSLRRAAQDGSVIALVPDWCMGGTSLVRVLPDWSVRGRNPDPAVWIIRPGRRLVPRRVEAFLDWIAQDRGKA